MSDNARAATLDELTRKVPRDLRAEWPIQWSEDGEHETGHSIAPVGDYIHRQREEIESLRAKLANKNQVIAQCIKQCEDEQAVSARMASQLAEKERECERLRDAAIEALEYGCVAGSAQTVLRRALENDDE